MKEIIPNAETIAAMEEARAGGGKSFETIDELMADLNSEDEGSPMTDYTRLIEAARSVIAAQDMQKPDPAPTGSGWLRWEAEKLEAQEKALAQLREALGEIDQA